MEGVSPTTYEVLLDTAGSRSFGISKEGGLGATLSIKEWSINSYLTVKPSMGITVLGSATPVEYNLPSKSFPIAQQSQMVNEQMVVLKTPIAIVLNDVSRACYVGDSIPITGTISPPEGGVGIRMMSKHEAGGWEVVGATTTDGRGTFRATWTPKRDGMYTLKAVHEGTAYTVEAESDVLNVQVQKPVQVHEPVQPSKPERAATPPSKSGAMPAFEAVSALLSLVVLYLMRRW